MYPDDLNRLAQQYGVPVMMSVPEPPLVKPLTSDDRVGEVCMVVRRPAGTLLVARKLYYPPGVVRLPTGGVGFSETVLDALLREVHEETGLTVALRRFLALVVYPPTSFFTAAFLLDELGGTLAPLDLSEQVESFAEITPAQLPMLAARLETLPHEHHSEIDGVWADWGRARAPMHRAVHQALIGPAHQATLFDGEPS